MGVCLISVGAAKAQTASEYLQYCSEFLSSAVQRGDQVLLPPGGASNCWHFFIAFRELADMQDQAATAPSLGLCIPTNVRLTQLIRMFVMYANAHPQALQQAPAVMAWQATWQYFNCNGPR
jgi:hypothetical protein